MEFVNCTRPPKLYRYSERKWLEQAMAEGRFLLKPASSYRDLERDPARQDDELVRIRQSPPEHVSIILQRTGQEIRPIGPVTYTNTSHSDYLVLCFSSRWGEDLFTAFPGTDTCLVIHDVETFAESLHAVVEAQLPGWAGIDAPVSYTNLDRLGVAFFKPERHATQAEFRFAWYPLDPRPKLEAISIRMGCLAGLAEIRPGPGGLPV
jgi:hypothetical protein